MDTLFGSPQAPEGGLLGMMQQSTDPKQLASMLAQSPTPQTVQKIIAQIQAAKIPDADVWAKVLMQAANDPQKLMMISQEVMKNAGPTEQPGPWPQ